MLKTCNKGEVAIGLSIEILLYVGYCFIKSKSIFTSFV